jgi:hypothetical protein
MDGYRARLQATESRSNSSMSETAAAPTKPVWTAGLVVRNALALGANLLGPMARCDGTGMRSIS